MFNQDSNHDLSRSSGSQASLMVEEGLNLSSREQTNFSLSSIQDQSVLISINEILGRAHVPLTSPEVLPDVAAAVVHAETPLPESSANMGSSRRTC